LVVDCFHLRGEDCSFPAPEKERRLHDGPMVDPEARPRWN
jgi:hypothetical protein